MNIFCHNLQKQIKTSSISSVTSKIILHRNSHHRWIRPRMCQSAMILVVVDSMFLHFNHHLIYMSYNVRGPPYLQTLTTPHIFKYLMFAAKSNNNVNRSYTKYTTCTCTYYRIPYTETATKIMSLLISTHQIENRTIWLVNEIWN